MSEIVEALRKKAMKLPATPGVYIMKNKHSEIIYIGKAKRLKNRVSTYFGSDKTFGEKVRRMVENVADFDYILVDSEYEALVLECSLIKQNKPKYNILLKDDKGINYIKITKGDWRMISTSHGKPEEDCDLIGPFTGMGYVTQAVEQACKIYKLPTCSKVFPRDINKSRPCLNFHLKQCSSPCSGKISHKDYSEAVDSAVRFILNGSSETEKMLRAQMEEAAENLQFELAAKFRDRLNALDKVAQKQKVVSTRIKNQDIFALAETKGRGCLMVLRFNGGSLYDSEYFFVDNLDSLSEARSEMILSYYSIRDNIPQRITVDGEVDDLELVSEHLSKKLGKKVTIAIPERGEQAQLCEMCLSNAFEKLAQQGGFEGKKLAAIDELAELLCLDKKPEYIEAYDISHTAGSDNVAGMVVFEDGKPLKKAYRRFSVKSFEGQDDYGSMREVLERRFNEYLEHKSENEGFGRLPDLILLDGGVGQVNAVKPLLDKFSLDIPLFGMVKDSKHRTKAVTGSLEEIAINANRKAFTLISEIQEEVHRFSIAYHHKKHKKASINSALCEISGVGETRAAKLMKHFKSVKAISEVRIDEIAAVKGVTKAAARSIYSHFHRDNILRAVIFDLDGTLLNTLDDLADSVNHCMREFNFPPREYSEIRSFVGNGILKLIERSVPEGTDKKTVEKCTELMLSYYAEHCNIKTAPYDGILDLLRCLKENNIKTACVTNKNQVMAGTLCEELFTGLIDVVIGAKRGIAMKPEPDGVFIAMKDMGVTNGECVYVGDSDVDILTAQNADLKSVGVTWGFRDYEVLRDAGADATVDSPKQLLELLQNNLTK